MCRLRIPGGDAEQRTSSAGWPTCPSSHAGGYADCTTRANLQYRDIGPIADGRPADRPGTSLGHHQPRQSGADNIRNVTAIGHRPGLTPTSLIDTRPLAKRMHHYILNHREMYGLPRKFNIAFDGGGRIHTLEETNDIGFTAVRVSDGQGQAEPGVYFRLSLGGITGHKDFARDTGVMCTESRVRAGGGRHRPFVHRARRPHRPQARPG